jgi:ribokinase
MSQPAIDVLVVGGINTDYFGAGETLPGPGQTQNGNRFLDSPGGKGANQAVAAARLGVSVALVGAVGADRRGRELIDHLRREGVDTRHVIALDGYATGAALIQIAGDGRKQILSVPGANQRLPMDHVRRACDTIGASRVVLVQLEVPLECVTLALESGRRQRAITVLDPAPPLRLTDAHLRLVDIVRPNAHEAEILTTIAVRDRNSAREAAVRLLRVPSKGCGAGFGFVGGGSDGTGRGSGFGVGSGAGKGTGSG